MKYFKKSEIKHYDKMSPRLLSALDNFRGLLKRPIYVSPASGATWRNDNSNSMHNGHNGRNGNSRAVDLFPDCDMFQAFINVLQIPEINGIGLYPHWNYNKLNWGMHIDIRKSNAKVIWWQNKHKEYFTIYTSAGFKECLDEYTRT